MGRIGGEVVCVRDGRDGGGVTRVIWDPREEEKSARRAIWDPGEAKSARRAIWDPGEAKSARRAIWDPGEAKSAIPHLERERDFGSQTLRTGTECSDRSSPCTE